MSDGVGGYMDQFNSFGDENTGSEFSFEDDDYVDFDVDDTLEDIEKAGYSKHIEEGLTGEKSAMRAFQPSASKYVNVGKCIAKHRYGRKAGQPCGMWTIRGSNYCITHGGRSPNVKKAAERRVQKAKEELQANIGLGVQRHLELIKSNETPHNVHLQAVKLLYDVAGVMNTEEEVVEEAQESPLAKLDGILSEMRTRITHERQPELEELVDEGEIIEDGIIVEEDNKES